MGDHDDETPGERRGIDRRTLIKGAAVAGAVGWTAPMILDSLTSPAAAFTGPKGCSIVCFNINCHADHTSAPHCALGTDCTPNFGAAPCITISSPCDGSASITISVVGGCTSCHVESWSAHVDPDAGQPNNGCFTGTGNTIPQTPFPGFTSTTINQVCVALRCV